MIRIPVTPEELNRLIEEEAPGWSKRAAERTRQVRRLKRFTGPGIWSEVKGVYMKLQHHKCAYCERPMAESPEAKIEYDVEHFRPKSRVTPWPDEDTAKSLRIRYKVRNGAARGTHCSRTIRATMPSPARSATARSRPTISPSTESPRARAVTSRSSMRGRSHSSSFPWVWTGLLPRSSSLSRAFSPCRRSVAGMPGNGHG